MHHQADPIRSRKVRSWKKVDLSVFREAIRESALANPSPSSSSSELFTVYDTCLRRVADCFAPEHTACSKVRPLSPWFDADCRAIRRNCRRLERRYRRTTSAEDQVEWIKAVRQKHVDFLEKKNNYWSPITIYLIGLSCRGYSWRGVGLWKVLFLNHFVEISSYRLLNLTLFQSEISAMHQPENVIIVVVRWQWCLL